MSLHIFEIAQLFLMHLLLLIVGLFQIMIELGMVAHGGVVVLEMILVDLGIVVVVAVVDGGVAEVVVGTVGERGK